MKSQTIAQLEAIRRIRNSSPDYKPYRNIHITILPDEELGGLRGMKPFVETEFFQNLNVGVDLDNGGYIDKDGNWFISYAEKNAWSK